MFDLHTALICLGLFSFVLGLICFTSARTFPNVHGMRKWGIVCFLSGMMWICYGFWNPSIIAEYAGDLYLVYLLTKVLGSLAAMFACGYTVTALSDLFAVTPPRIVRPLVVAGTLGVLACAALEPGNTYLIIPSTFPPGILMGIAAWTIYRNTDFKEVPAIWLALSAMVVFSLVLLGRGFFVLLGHGTAVTIFTKAGIPFVFLAVGGLSSLSIFISFLLLANHKMRLIMLESTKRDLLTGLYTRAAFFDIADKMMASSVPCAVAMLDIDHFKKINDTYGHASGDIALSYVARFIENCARNMDIVGRYGGEEFCVIIQGPNSANDIETFALRVVAESHKQRIRLPDDFGEIGFTLSIGYFAVAVTQSLTAAKSLDYADKALYVAKNSGRDRAVRYCEKMTGKPEQAVPASVELAA
jgi:diguanylate cyclase (GGDEF)-like protein